MVEQVLQAPSWQELSQNPNVQNAAKSGYGKTFTWMGDLLPSIPLGRKTHQERRAASRVLIQSIEPNFDSDSDATLPIFQQLWRAVTGEGPLPTLKQAHWAVMQIEYGTRHANQAYTNLHRMLMEHRSRK